MVRRGVEVQNDEWAAALRPAQAPRRTRRWSPLTVGLSVGLASYLALCWLLLEPEQPVALQRLLALVFVALTGGVYVAATRSTETQEDKMLRLRSGRHADFGKQLRVRQQRHRTIPVPGIGEMSYRLLGGVAVCSLAAIWWMTPWAPIGVEKRAIQDLTVPLGQTIAAAELVMLDGYTAVCLPPVISEQAKAMASTIPDGAGAYERALRAIAEERFGEAESLLDEAAHDENVLPEQISLARAHGYMYAGRFLDAAAEYTNVIAVKPDTVLGLCQAAVAWMQAGDSAKAEPLLARAGELCRPQMPDYEAIRGFYLHGQALLNVYRGRRYDDAEQLFKQSRDLWEQSLPGDTSIAAVSRSNQAVVYVLRARYPVAHELIAWSRESRQTPLGRANVLGNLGMLLYIRGDLSGAQSRFASAGKILAEGTLAVPPSVAAVHQAQRALLNWSQWKYKAGKAIGEAALLKSNESVGAEHPLSAPILVTLATLYRDQSLYAKAEPYYFRALSISRRAYGDEHPHVAGVLVRLAELHLARKGYREAELAIDRATKIFEKAYGAEHPALATALNLRGELELNRGLARDARRPLERALKIFDAVYGREHPAAARTLGNLAAIESSPRTYRRGIALYEEANAAITASLGPEHPEVAWLLFGVASLYASQGDYVQARPAAERCLAIREKVLPPFHPDLAAACELVAEVLENLARPEIQLAAELRARAKGVRQRHAQEDRSDSSG